MGDYGKYNCWECNYCIVAFGKNRDKMWCELHKKRVNEEDRACFDFVNSMEGEEDEHNS